MKRLKPHLLLLALLCVVSSATAQLRRGSIQMPDIDGYITLKCDFHLHTVFSDGLVWPKIRVDEAYIEGLDAIALTDHIEYRPFKDIIDADHNKAYDITKDYAEECGIILIKGSEMTRSYRIGHFNALFLKDSNPLDNSDWREAFAEAKRQGAYIYWDHPGWDNHQPDKTVWREEQTELLEMGCLRALEVVNGEFYPEALTWCLEKNLTILSGSDAHYPMEREFDLANGKHRTITLVFAKERTQEAIREALESRRTAVWHEDMIIGEESILREFAAAAIDIDVERTQKGVTISFTNKTDMPINISKRGRSNSLICFRNIVLKPHTTTKESVRFDDGVTGGYLNLELTNFMIGVDKYLTQTLNF